MKDFNFFGTKGYSYIIRGKANEIPVIQEAEEQYGVQFPEVEVLVVVSLNEGLFHFDFYNGFTCFGTRYFQFGTEEQTIGDDIQYVNDMIVNNLDNMNWTEVIDEYLNELC